MMGSLTEITKKDLVEMVKRMYRTIDEKKEFLSKLDTEIGDGDHGFSMFSGFKSFHDKLGEFSELPIGQLLKKGGFELIKTIGGAAGAVFGTFFTGQASYYDKNLEGKESLNLEDFTNMLNEALDQIKKRGNANPGDKTMIDALEPAVNELYAGIEKNLSLSNAFKNAAEKAEQGAENTKNMVSKRGRSKNLGERSIGFMDAGAMSTSIIFRTIADYIENPGT
jgi:dihydroxyacetone kinase-like protein